MQVDQQQDTAAPQAQQPVFIQGQELLTASMLDTAPPQEQKQMLGQCLFQLVQTMYLTLARKIAGTLFGIYYAELQLSEVQGELFNTQ